MLVFFFNSPKKPNSLLPHISASWCMHFILIIGYSLLINNIHLKFLSNDKLWLLLVIMVLIISSTLFLRHCGYVKYRVLLRWWYERFLESDWPLETRGKILFLRHTGVWTQGLLAFLTSMLLWSHAPALFALACFSDKHFCLG